MCNFRDNKSMAMIPFTDWVTLNRHKYRVHDNKN